MYPSGSRHPYWRTDSHSRYLRDLHRHAENFSSQQFYSIDIFLGYLSYRLDPSRHSSSPLPTSPTPFPEAQNQGPSHKRSRSSSHRPYMDEIPRNSPPPLEVFPILSSCTREESKKIKFTYTPSCRGPWVATQADSSSARDSCPQNYRGSGS